jgi:hypothetical protein
MKQALNRPVVARRPRGTTLRSDDGAIEFTLAPTSAGLFVERVQLGAGTARIFQSALFTDDKAFGCWCDADAARFDYPDLHVRLKRNGDALFDRTR